MRISSIGRVGAIDTGGRGSSRSPEEAAAKRPETTLVPPGGLQPRGKEAQALLDSIARTRAELEALPVSSAPVTALPRQAATRKSEAPALHAIAGTAAVAGNRAARRKAARAQKRKRR